VGRRLLAFRLADLLLGGGIGIPDPVQLDGGRIDDEWLQVHPDLRVLQPEEDKNKPGKFRKNIAVEQVRELIDFLSMTSHQGGAKVAIIAPAQTMNRNTANCLLKTLEEPATDNYLILVAESVSGLPATIISRCHRIRVPQPKSQVAINWLNGSDAKVDWHSALELSAGAPLAALEWQRINFPEIVGKLEHDLSALRQCAETPAIVARRWVKYDQEPCLRWLFNRLGAEIRSQSGGQAPDSIKKPDNRHLQKPGETLNIDSAFAVLRQIGELRRLQGAGLNMELHLTDVLTWWYGSGH
jgi:DNA polymerase-3 subunit delta'